MSSTPRPRSGAFPQTPATTARAAPLTPSPTPSPAVSSSAKSPLPLAPQSSPSTRAANTAPLIPLRILDAPTQRFYAVAVYIALLGWRLYDWVQLVEDNAESFWLLLKWLFIDFIFLFGLPELRIPWLELSQPFVVMAFFVHVALNFILMFNIGVGPRCATRDGGTYANQPHSYLGRPGCSACSRSSMTENSPSPSTMSSYRAYCTIPP